ncbi:MAG: DRTGG domain-containing protein [Bacillota bacterium]|nr:DRTGG domain-containing protein [Bacillota bacterium]
MIINSGKTPSVGLALKLVQEGKKVSYLKPVGNVVDLGRREDDDTVLMKEVLGMEESLGEITPLTVGASFIRYQRSSAEYLHRIKESHRKLAAKSDLVIIESGPSPELLFSIGLDAATIAQELKAAVVMVSKAADDWDLDRTLLFNEYLRSRQLRVLGTIFNHVSKQVMDKVRGVYQPLLEEKGFPVLGIVAAQRDLTLPTVREVWDILGGELLEGEEYLDRRVEEIMIGAMNLESALTFFRRAVNKAVVTGGDRTGVALAALETDTSVLILTGDVYPDVKVVARAHEKGVPVILVPTDTYTTVERLHRVARKIRPTDTAAISLARQNVEEHVNWAQLFQALEEARA